MALSSLEGHRTLSLRLPSHASHASRTDGRVLGDTTCLDGISLLWAVEHDLQLGRSADRQFAVPIAIIP